LIVEGCTLAENDLVVPHPELANRRFVLEPLQELSPELELADGRTPGEASVAIGDGQRVTRIASLN
jgi:2-amino-4-hydroxy-6-hydroxymethyldihydropteridine diphosphokinase